MSRARSRNESLARTVEGMQQNFLRNMGSLASAARSAVGFAATALMLVDKAEAQVNGERTLPADPTQASTAAPSTSTTTQAPTSSSTTRTLSQTITEILTTLSTMTTTTTTEATTTTPRILPPPGDDWDRKWLLALLAIPVAVAAYLLYRYCRPHERVQTRIVPLSERDGNEGQIDPHSTAEFMAVIGARTRNNQAWNDDVVLELDRDHLPGAVETVVDIDMNRQDLSFATTTFLTQDLCGDLAELYGTSPDAIEFIQERREALFAERVQAYEAIGLSAEDLIQDINTAMPVIKTTVAHSEEAQLATQVARGNGNNRATPQTVTDGIFREAMDDLAKFVEMMPPVHIERVQTRADFRTRTPSPSPRDPEAFTPGGDRRMIYYDAGNTPNNGGSGANFV